MTDRTRIVITGASGFLGRHLLAAMKDRYRIYALGRRSPDFVQAPTGPSITWRQVDIADKKRLNRIFGEIAAEGGAAFLVHLAAHYDFTGEDHPEYWRTNVTGLRNVLEASRVLGLKRFVFASSVAACRFPPDGRYLDEKSPADGDVIYARTKRIGEEMLREFEADFPSVVVRMGALFSDYCEYPPLFFFLGTWLSRSWRRRILAGRGESAIPYLHVRDAVSFFERLPALDGALQPGEVLIASPGATVSHRELFEEATLHYHGRKGDPILMPRWLCRIGVHAGDLAGRFIGNRPFERPWMSRYIDLKLSVDGSATREKTGWSPTPRLQVLRRMPFLVENCKTHPMEWNRRNWAILRKVRFSDNLLVHQLLEENMERIVAAVLEKFSAPDAAAILPNYSRLDPAELAWAVNQVHRHLMNSVRAGEKALFRAHCRDLATRRSRQGFRRGEVVRALTLTAETCMGILREDPGAAELPDALYENITMTFRFGIDEVEDVFDEFEGAFVDPENMPA